MSLNEKITLDKVAGVGPSTQASFKYLGVETLKDLVYFLPKRVVDLSKVSKISAVKDKLGQSVVLACRVKSVNLIRSKIKKLWIVEALLEDESGAIEAVWFNQPYLYKSLKKSEELVIYGEVNLSLKKIIINNPEIYQKAGLYPIYRQRKNLTSRQISKVIKKILKPSLMPEDPLPQKIIKEYELPCLLDAAKWIHNPASISQFGSGRYRFLFEELFIFALTNLVIKREFEGERSAKIDQIDFKKIEKLLPYDLTTDQKKVIGEIWGDFIKPHPMNRMIQGDVGSGKTIVAFISGLAAIKSGFEVAFLAPTEILANQHYQTFCDLIGLLKINNVCLSLVTSKNKKNINDANFFVGTHALLNINYKNLGLLIVDEQQRFGVKQRNILLEKGKLMPHYLSLSATPIPRSLSHVIFANCDLSVIREKPKGRKKISTFIIPEEKRNNTYDFIDRLIKKKQQVLVVCPLIFKGDEFDERASVNSELEILKKTVLRKHKIALLHGKMSSRDKEKVVDNFRQNKINILISTSVVEVGVDIKNLTAIVIEDAQMFGLSQLHQFRGRVGRGSEQSFCFVFAKLNDNITKERLKAFVRSDDGFALSQIDLRLRGPGSFFDKNQSGFSGINPLWFEDSKLLHDAISAAKKIKELSNYPALREIIQKNITVKHLD
ncbi:MAG: ATP-dependent DNA helicase RecG [bacterium]